MAGEEGVFGIENKILSKLKESGLWISLIVVAYFHGGGEKS